MKYAGDVSPKQAWEILAQEPGAVLVDVRTQPEWTFVGVPDLGNLGKRAMLLSWQVYPQMAIDADFVTKLKSQLGSADADAPVLFICRSGARSRSAAQAATAAGFKRCYNVAEGFEGDKDASSHRGQRGGWKAAGLPWVQD
jgi:rhodanese-related sulfurtransferase